MILKNLLYSALLGVALLTNCGCIAALLVGGGAGAGTVAYIKGELKSTEEAPLDKTWQAALTAVEDLEFIVTSKEKDAFSGKLIAHKANDKKVEIYFQKATENTTNLRIRVGVFGDETLSLMILERLRKYL